MPAAALEVLGASHRLAEHTSQMQWFHRKLESCRISDQQQITKQWPSPFFLCKFGFGKCFGTSIPSSHWADHCWLSHAIHFSLQFKIRLRNGLLLCRIRWHFKTVIYLNFWSAHEAPTYQAFHISNLFQTANDHKMVWVEFLGNFLCNCKRISFDPLRWSLTTSDGRHRASHLQGLEPSLRCMFISNSWAKCIVDVASCLFCFMTQLQLE